MRSSFALAALALAPTAFAGPVVHDVVLSDAPVFFSETLPAADRPSTTRPPPELVSELSASTADFSTYDRPVIVVEPPPIFDPPEPRPGSIFVSDSGMVVDSLPKPPPLSLWRPERLSAFEGSHVHPSSNPYPPDSYDFAVSDTVYTDCAWVQALSIVGALATVLSVAGIVVWTFERMLSRVWHSKRRNQRLSRPDMWKQDLVEEGFYETRGSRKRSFGGAVAMY